MIGSQDAWRYLKALKSYDILCQEMHKDPLIKYKPNPKETSLICHNLSSGAHVWLDYISAKFSTKNDLSCAAYHQVIVEIGMPYEDYRADYLWSLDYAMVIKHLLSAMDKLPTKTTVIDFFFGQGKHMKCFTLLGEPNQKVSGIDIIKNPQLRKIDQEDFWIWVDDPQEGILTRREHANLVKALEEKDLTMCHKLARKIALEEAQGHLRHWLEYGHGVSALSATVEEMEFLLEMSKLFDRAERELTLGRLEVERKFALAFVYKVAITDPFDSIQELVEKAIGYSIRMRENRKERLGKMLKLKAPNIFIRNEQGLVRQAEYLHLSLYQNRRWLEKYFSQ